MWSSTGKTEGNRSRTATLSIFLAIREGKRGTRARREIKRGCIFSPVQDNIVAGKEKPPLCMIFLMATEGDRKGAKLGLY